MSTPEVIGRFLGNELSQACQLHGQTPDRVVMHAIQVAKPLAAHFSARHLRMVRRTEAGATRLSRA